jgi:hypothetical protein
MSGVSKFINRGEQGPPPSAQPNQERLAAAARARVSPKPKEPPFSTNPHHPIQELASTAPAPGYVSNPAAVRNTFPAPQYQPEPYGQYQQPQRPAKGIFDVTDSLDDLESDAGHGGEDTDSQVDGHQPPTQKSDPDDEYGEDEDYGLKQESNPNSQRHGFASQMPQPQHDLRHKHSQTNLDQAGKHRGSGISGRFERLSPQEHGNMEIRPGQSGPLAQIQDLGQQYARSNNNRGRSPEYIYESQAVLQHQGKYNGHPTHQSSVPSNGAPQHEQGASFEDVDDGQRPLTSSQIVQEQESIELVPFQETPDYKLAELLQIQDPLAADYTDDELKVMSYQDLNKESWETRTRGKKREAVAEIPDFETKFWDTVKLDCKDIPDEQVHAKQCEIDAKQEEFFRSLSTKQWEEAGDLFVGRMGEILIELKKARQEKRRIAEKFEAEIEEKEAAIRGKFDNIEEKLNQMRQGGEGVLKGKV